MSTKFPYSLSELRLKNDEPLNYAYFNAHMLRILADIRSINKSSTLQKATTTQWGVARYATIDDVISEDGDRNAILTNDILNKAIKKLKDDNEKSYKATGLLPLSKNYEWRHGEFMVGLGESIAKKITDFPDMVVYANVYFVPLGYESKPYRTANSKPHAEERFFKENLVTCGVINFDDKEMPENYEEFHVYYHKAGYVICRNGRVQDAQKQIRVVWNLLFRKRNEKTK